MGSFLLLGLGLGLTSILAAAGALVILFATQSSRRKQASVFEERQKGTVFLFDGEHLVDSTPGGRSMLASAPPGATTWARLLARLEPLFPEFERHLPHLEDLGVITLEGVDAEGIPLLIRAERRGGLTWIRVSDAAEGHAHKDDPLVHRAMTEELASLRSMLTQAPILAWRERADGGVIWANGQYVTTVAESLGPGEELGWPLPRLFDRTGLSPSIGGQRQKLTRPNGTTSWFDIVVVAEHEGRRVYALPCDSAVVAETNLRDFMQTLAKTFAHLPIGLAVFDGHKHLQMFNPALMDLTGLQPDFLSARPSMVAFLDAMRDQNMLPEPKDYRQWRKHMVDMEGADETGFFEEIWTLSGGQTYRLTGRPHTNGSVALMFEDISTEILQSRRYRADVEMGQAVVDAMDEAVAVFSVTGQLVMANRAYAELWENDPAGSLADASFATVMSHWRERCAPSMIWAEMEAFVATIGDRVGWTTEARLTDGRLFTCRLHPLQDGATLIGFRMATAAEKLEPKKALLRRPA